MANKLTKAQRKALEDLRTTFALGPGYSAILRESVINDWNEQEIIQAVIGSDHFRASYPGLLNAQGDLRDFLTGQANANLTPQNLGAAIANYNKLRKGYDDATEGYKGITGRITNDKMALLIRNEVSPTEFRANLHAVQTVTRNAETFKIYNQQRKLEGLKPLDDADLFKAVATEDQKFKDAYEATRLRQLGGDLFGKKDAAKVAASLRNVNTQGQSLGVATDDRIGQLVAELSSHLSDFGPEMRAAGIDNITLARYIANPSANPKIAERLKQLASQRRSQGAYVAGTQARKGEAGGLALYPDEKTANY